MTFTILLVLVLLARGTLLLACVLIVAGNKIVNRLDGGFLLRNDTKLAPQMAKNEIENQGAKPLALVSPGSPKPVAPADAPLRN